MSADSPDSCFARKVFIKRESDLSLMPEGLQPALSVQDFADLASFLESLKEPVQAKP